MAEKYTLIDDIIKDHSERILNLRKFYPFFSLSDGTFASFKEGKFADLDMGYIVLATLRYFINENNFNDTNVLYENYERFMGELLVRDFEIETDGDTKTELIRYIFDRIRNYGKPFEVNFFDPADRKKKTVRVRLIETIVKEEGVEYSITEDAIEFYLATKEMRDESRITTEQLLLEKLIKAENFRGGIDVIERINMEVSALKKRRDEVVDLLLSDVVEGAKAVDRYMADTSQWFQDERKSFAKNRELLDKAIARIPQGMNTAAMNDIKRLEVLLKTTIENHSDLISSTAELSRFESDLISRNKARSLKSCFDFEDILMRAQKKDRVDILQLLVEPLFLPRRRKSFDITAIDNMILQRTADGTDVEKKEIVGADLNFRYDDEILHAAITVNFGRLFVELLDRLTLWKKLTLSEYNAILEVRFGEDIYKNRDYYSFLTHLAEKKDYNLSQMEVEQETFLEEMVMEAMSPEDKKKYKNIKFKITMGREDVPVGDKSKDDISYVSDMTFELVE